MWVCRREVFGITRCLFFGARVLNIWLSVEADWRSENGLFIILPGAQFFSFGSVMTLGLPKGQRFFGICVNVVVGIVESQWVRFLCVCCFAAGNVFDLDVDLCS